MNIIPILSGNGEIIEIIQNSQTSFGTKLWNTRYANQIGWVRLSITQRTLRGKCFFLFFLCQRPSQTFSLFSPLLPLLVERSVPRDDGNKSKREKRVFERVQHPEIGGDCRIFVQHPGHYRTSAYRPGTVLGRGAERVSILS